jgi:hypothetical protein
MIDHVSAWFWGEASQPIAWYDSIELIRQPRVGEWAPVVSKVRDRIEAMARR